MKQGWGKLGLTQALLDCMLPRRLRLLFALLTITNVTAALTAEIDTCSLVLDAKASSPELFFGNQRIDTNWITAELPCNKLRIELRYPEQPADIRTIAFTTDALAIKLKPDESSVVIPVDISQASSKKGRVTRSVAGTLGATPCPITAKVKNSGIYKPNQTFSEWLAGFKTQAAECGVSADTINAAFQGVYLEQKFLDIDGRQSEFNSPFSDYLTKRVTKFTIDKGKFMLAKHRNLLRDLTARYEVPATVLVAFWGLESNFGRDTGNNNSFVALSTLAYDGRRRDFYQQQLLAALQIIDDGHITPQQMRGSWAGAMGHFQFMPTTFREYAIDGDGDGSPDIWNSIPDALTSAANYLHGIGWRGQLAGMEVSLPDRFDAYDCSEQKYPNSYWSALGVTTVDGSTLPYADAKGSMLLPSGIGGPAFLVYNNFDIITQWNKSTFYALAVVNLSQRLAGGGPLQKLPAREKPLAKEQVKELQTNLLSLGFDVGKPDGMIGQRTRQAVCKYQIKNHIIPDAYPTQSLIDAVHTEAFTPPPAPSP